MKLTEFLSNAHKATRKVYQTGNLNIMGETVIVTIYDQMYNEKITENGIEKIKTLTVGCLNVDLYTITENFDNIKNEIVVLNDSETFRVDNIISNSGIVTIYLVDPN